MTKRIIKINEELCNGCGACAAACHEGAIAMLEGKAKLTREDYCDGLGDCLPVCPTGAISFVEVEREKTEPNTAQRTGTQWPVQLKLIPARAACFQDRELLLAADCTAFVYSDFYRRYGGGTTLIGCPKLDGVDYSVKLTQILQDGKTEHITLLRMEVPCCGGLEYALKKAIEASGRDIELNVETISVGGELIHDT